MPVLVLFKPWWDFYVTKIVDSSGLIISHLKNCILLGPNWWILLGFWKGQIEKKFQSGIHLGQFRFYSVIGKIWNLMWEYYPSAIVFSRSTVIVQINFLLSVETFKLKLSETKQVFET